MYSQGEVSRCMAADVSFWITGLWLGLGLCQLPVRVRVRVRVKRGAGCLIRVHTQVGRFTPGPTLMY